MTGAFTPSLLASPASATSSITWVAVLGGIAGAVTFSCKTLLPSVTMTGTLHYMSKSNNPVTEEMVDHIRDSSTDPDMLAGLHNTTKHVVTTLQKGFITRQEALDAGTVADLERLAEDAQHARWEARRQKRKEQRVEVTRRLNEIRDRRQEAVQKVAPRSDDMSVLLRPR